MLIGGQWVDSENGETSNVINPANDDVIATVPKATIQDVENCISASRTAFLDSSWKKMDPAQRGRILNKMAAATYSSAKELAKLNQKIMVRLFARALSEIRYGAWTLEYFADSQTRLKEAQYQFPEID